MATLLKRNMRLFGIPYQFLPSVDPRIPNISTTVGRKFAENIILDAPVITLIPGKPKYLPGAKNKEDKMSTTQSIISAGSDYLEPLKTVINDKLNNNEDFKYYDFEGSYTEYMTYVNILCRTCASFLEISETIDGTPCQSYDYRYYKWDIDSYKGNSSVEKIFNSLKTSGSSFVSKIIGKDNVKVSSSDTNISSNNNTMKYETTTTDIFDEVNDIFTNYRYVQFFIDSGSTADETMTNNTTETKIKGMLDQGSDLLKELSFITNSGGMDMVNQLTQFASDSAESLSGVVDKLDGNTGIADVFSRFLNLSGNIAKGENVVMPDIYQNSSYDKSYSFTVHLKSPYGTKFGYFMDICVPLMHLIALGIPKQTSANTYGSPFLIKAYCEGLFTCNLGIITSVSISKGVNSAFSVDGLPTEVDVTLSIADLYSDLSMSPQSNISLFVNNDSLIDYLSTTCGLSLITPNVSERWKMLTNTVINTFSDIDNNIISGLTEEIDKLARDFFGLKH